MEQQFITFAQIIAFHLVALGADVYNFEIPILWSSGTYNPFYVDNRVLMSVPGVRKILRQALSLLISNKISVDYIYGIPKAGIPPATLLALEDGKPLLIKYEGRYYGMDIKVAREFVRNSLTELMKSADVIAGTTLFGTILGIIAAEEMEKPFLFVREKGKEHGLRKQVEGLVVENDFCLLIDPKFQNSVQYTVEAVRALQEVKVKALSYWLPPIDSIMYEVDDFAGKAIVVQEDVVGTGKSMLKELLYLKDMGATVLPQSIFSYNLDEATKNFEEYGLVNKSCTNFEELFAQRARNGSWSIEVQSKLWDWNKNQAIWGDKHGFKSEQKGNLFG